MRLVSIVLKVLAGLAAFLLLFYVSVNVAAVAEGVVQRHRISEDVTDVLPRILPSAEEAQDELVESVGAAPDRRWIEQACRFATDESGWIVVNHRETCVMRSVTAWRVGSEQEARDLSGIAEQGRSAYGGCLSLGPVGEPGVVEGPEATYVVATSDDEPWCTGGLGTTDDGRALRGERSGLGDGRWLVLVAEQPLVDEPIGCAHWSILFCDNPWTGHAFGDVPD